MDFRLVVALSGVLLLLGVFEAQAQTPRRKPPVQTFQQGGVGCYWYRGRYFCARYCYLEVDGKRYCVDREREARSQAAELDHEDARGPRRTYSGAK
jgi:hypothetical protein